MSTQFTVGLDGSRNSSKVLKPPGGGASDIFGLSASNVTKSNESAKSEDLMAEKIEQVPAVNVSVSAPAAKTKVRRNPITGEGIEIPEEKDLPNPVSEKVTELPKTEAPKVQTSIRVRNPPGGKSSGIF